MKKTCFLLILCLLNVCFSGEKERKMLSDIYQKKCKTASDINKHLPALKALAVECPRVAEIGVRSLVSTWAFLQGLAENNQENRFYLGIDINAPPKEDMELIQKLATSQGISFFFWLENDLNIEIDEIDLLFIDSLHTYCHLSYELEIFSPKVTRYIALHDTSPPFGYKDQECESFSEYPEWIDRTKRGLWPAVVDFLKRHPEWILHKRYKNNNGLTVLRRIDSLNLTDIDL